MDKLKKTIKGLECLAGMNTMKSNPCMDCGYQECQTYAICIEEIAADALSLLKAQEPKLVYDIAEATLGYKPKVKVGHCPSCGVLMSETDRFCRKCGQAVKWE